MYVYVAMRAFPPSPVRLPALFIMRNGKETKETETRAEKIGGKSCSSANDSRANAELEGVHVRTYHV